MTLFLDGLFILLVIYVITQILLPMIFPSDLERNWFFKKKSKTATTAKKAIKMKRVYSDVKDEVVVEAGKKMKEAQELKDAIKQSKK